MRLKGDVVDRLRQVLGGKTPTEKRIVKLLEEVEQRRQVGQVEAAAVRMGLLPGPEAPAGGSEVPQSPLEALREDLGDGGEIVLEDAPESPQAIPEPVQPAPGPGGWDEERKILYATLKQMQEKIADLSRPVTAEDKNQAIGAGKLPVNAVAAPPIGFTGPASLPRGEWFVSPSFAPPIKMWICGCPECKTRLSHYRCVICHAGPFFYDPRKGRSPQGRKDWFAPGAQWGISHEACSPLCWMQYSQVYLGPGQGQGMAQPELAEAAGEPVRVTRGSGSD